MTDDGNDDIQSAISGDQRGGTGPATEPPDPQRIELTAKEAWTLCRLIADAEVARSRAQQAEARARSFVASIQTDRGIDANGAEWTVDDAGEDVALVEIPRE